MTIAFEHSVDVPESMLFDDVYEEALQLSVDEKRELLGHCIAAWLLYDGELAGEIYGLSPQRLWNELGEDIEDTDPSDGESLYVFSTTILPRFQGRGLAMLLKAYFAGIATARGYAALVGHATSPAMVAINRKFGATFGAVHEHWYGTARVARFYRIALSRLPAAPVP